MPSTNVPRGPIRARGKAVGAQCRAKDDGAQGARLTRCRSLTAMSLFVTASPCYLLDEQLGGGATKGKTTKGKRVMVGKLNRFCLALIAVWAIGAAIAGTSTADVLTSEAASTTLTGVQEGQNWLFTGGEVKCTTVKYHGALSSTSSSQFTVTPTYSGCTFVGLAATFSMNGCDYLVRINAAAGNTTGTIDVVCSGGKEATITAPSVGTAKCIVHIPPQTGLGPVSAVNLGSTTTREITLSLNITNIAYSQTAGTAETGNCATADSKTGGTHTGSALFTGENAAGTSHIGIFLS